MAADPARFLAEWHRLVRAKDLDARARVLADDVTIGVLIPPINALMALRDRVTARVDARASGG